jgi:hypothetical protein
LCEALLPDHQTKISRKAAKRRRIFTEGHKAASPRPNTKKSFTQEGHKGRKEIPYQEFKTDCSVSIRFVFATFAALL